MMAVGAKVIIKPVFVIVYIWLQIVLYYYSQIREARSVVFAFLFSPVQCRQRQE